MQTKTKFDQPQMKLVQWIYLYIHENISLIFEAKSKILHTSKESPVFCHKLIRFSLIFYS